MNTTTKLRKIRRNADAEYAIRDRVGFDNRSLSFYGGRS